MAKLLAEELQIVTDSYSNAVKSERVGLKRRNRNVS